MGSSFAMKQLTFYSIDRSACPVTYLKKTVCGNARPDPATYVEGKI